MKGTKGELGRDGEVGANGPRGPVGSRGVQVFFSAVSSYTSLTQVEMVRIPEVMVRVNTKFYIRLVVNTSVNMTSQSEFNRKPLNPFRLCRYQYKVFP